MSDPFPFIRILAADGAGPREGADEPSLDWDADGDEAGQAGDGFGRLFDGGEPGAEPLPARGTTRSDANVPGRRPVGSDGARPAKARGGAGGDEHPVDGAFARRTAARLAEAAGEGPAPLPIGDRIDARPGIDVYGTADEGGDGAGDGAMPRPVARGGLAPHVLKRVTERMAGNLSEELSLAELAAEARLSPWHFARAFKQSTGEPPHGFRTRLRIEHAKALLTETDEPVSVIAEAVGYDSAQSLARAFRKMAGRSPSAWRRAGRG